MRVTFLGHACHLVEVDGMRILTDPWLVDPIFENHCERDPALAFGPADLPPLDAIAITHGHLDHFNAPTLAALPDKSIPVVHPPIRFSELDANLRRLGFEQSARARRLGAVRTRRPRAHRADAVTRRARRVRVLDRGPLGVVLERRRRAAAAGGDRVDREARSAIRISPPSATTPSTNPRCWRSTRSRKPITAPKAARALRGCSARAASIAGRVEHALVRAERRRDHAQGDPPRRGRLARVHGEGRAGTRRARSRAWRRVVARGRRSNAARCAAPPPHASRTTTSTRSSRAASATRRRTRAPRRASCRDLPARLAAAPPRPRRSHSRCSSRSPATMRAAFSVDFRDRDGGARRHRRAVRTAHRGRRLEGALRAAALVAGAARLRSPRGDARTARRAARRTALRVCPAGALPVTAPDLSVVVPVFNNALDARRADRPPASRRSKARASPTSS